MTDDQFDRLAERYYGYKLTIAPRSRSQLLTKRELQALRWGYETATSDTKRAVVGRLFNE